MSPKPIDGRPGSGMPVATSPTTATPFAGRSSRLDRTIPTMSATSAPGMRGAMRLRARMPTSEPIPSAVV